MENPTQSKSTRPSLRRAAVLGGLVVAGALIAGCGVGGGIQAAARPTVPTSGRVTVPTTSPPATAPTTAPPATAPTLPPVTSAPTPTVVTRTPPTTPAPAATTTPPASPHFDTPQAAMVYLASAWNRNDEAELMQVTVPAARAQLEAMKQQAVDLRLDHCTPRPGMGDYVCYFAHYYDPPASQQAAPYQLDQFLVAPASLPGWYMTVFMGCD